MANAVRFYWLRGEQAIPLDAIPEEDHHPLRVRRRVVQSHAPNVIKQLEENRFVAVAWESDGSISMILCHPKLAKAAADTPFLNTMATPMVVLKVGSWDEAADVSRLFLKAFGSEAGSTEECAQARRDLAAWLAEHGQPAMAAVVKHFQGFPFGVRSDALEVINIWRQVLVQGAEERIGRFLEEVGRRFEALGWRREPTTEGRLNPDPRQQNHFYCWISGPANGPHILLCLNRATDRRVRGGTYDLLDERAGISDLASEIQRVLADVLEPAAAAVGLEVSYPRLGPISRVSAKTAAAMTTFAEAGDGQWPLPEPVEQLWRKVVYTAYRDEVAINPDELTAWFVASGWDNPGAVELTKRFYNEVALLEEYEKSGRQPA